MVFELLFYNINFTCDDLAHWAGICEKLYCTPQNVNSKKQIKAFSWDAIL